MKTTMWELITTLESQIDNRGISTDVFNTIERMKDMCAGKHEEVGMTISEWMATFAVVIPVFIIGIIIGLLF